MSYIEVDGKKIYIKNSYGWYSAEYVKAMKIPRCKIDIQRKDNWYSATQCKKIKMPISIGEKPVACSASQNGYYLLYERDYPISFRDL